MQGGQDMDKKILIADDEASIRNALAYALKREGFLVETAGDGEDALEKVRLFHPDVLILDVMMPKLGGYEVCRRLESRKGIGILLLTAKNDIVDKVLGLELGADDFMSKPFDLRELLARIKSIGTETGARRSACPGRNRSCPRPITGTSVQPNG